LVGKVKYPRANPTGIPIARLAAMDMALTLMVVNTAE